MAFFGVLVLVNVVCFLPVYLLNIRESPNPFEFLLTNDKTVLQSKLKYVYAKLEFTDPFKINFDFTFVVLVAVAMGAESRGLIWGAAALLALGFVEILYGAVMQSIFKRPPTLAGDLSLLKTGIMVAQRRLYALSALVLAVLAAIGVAAYLATSWLFRLEPPDPRLALIVALLLLPLCLYHWRRYAYPSYLARTVYSPLLHLVRNIEYGKRLNVVLEKDAAHFERRNHFKGVTLAKQPTIVVICVESYGSVVYRDPAHSAAVADLVASYEQRLGDSGYRFASTHSDAPIFAGGSWLSYASLTYGIEFTEPQLFDALFAAKSPFGCLRVVVPRAQAQRLPQCLAVPARRRRCPQRRLGPDRSLLSVRRRHHVRFARLPRAARELLRRRAFVLAARSVLVELWLRARGARSLWAVLVVLLHAELPLSVGDRRRSRRRLALARRSRPLLCIPAAAVPPSAIAPPSATSSTTCCASCTSVPTTMWCSWCSAITSRQ